MFPGFGHRPPERHHEEQEDQTERRGRRRGGRLLDYGELRLLILSFLADRPSHGYELIKSVEERFGGSYTPSPGVLYPTLAWLEDTGYAIAEPGEGNRKNYRITTEGRAYLASNPAGVAALRAPCGRGGPFGGRHGAPAAVAEAMDEVKAALRGRLKASVETPEALEHIVRVLREAARQIEAGDCPDGQTTNKPMESKHE